jgi:hypothetical protein
MNERIKELAELSIKESGQEFWWLTNDLVIEKFAELIVAECADFANDHNSEVEGVTLGVGRALKQHFGIEE